MSVLKETVELQDGKLVDDYYLWNEGLVSIVVPEREDGLILCVRQYKHGLGRIIIEFPAGLVEDDSSIVAAHKELLEETGFKASSMELIGEVVNAPGKIRGRSEVFLAKNLAKVQEQTLDDNEDIEVLFLSEDQISQAIIDGEIVTSSIIAAWHLYQKHNRHSSFLT
jgi:8-oxo-dGTP pyrophosphatase MutT (NUDIX family)